LEARVAECVQARDGDCLLGLADFEAAAQAFEARARAGGVYAATALSRAVRLRRELGHVSDVRALADEFRRLYLRHPRASEVTEDVFRLDEFVKDPKGLVEHWKTYLRDWAALGGMDRTIVAHARLGRLLLDASCPVAGVRGACVEIKQEQRKCPQWEERPDPEWGPPPRLRGERSYAVRGTLRHARDARLVRQAEDHFELALRLASSFVRVLGSDPDERAHRRDDLADAIAESMLLLAHADRDAYLSSSLPQGLDFRPPGYHDSPAVACRRKNMAEWSGKRYVGWLEEKGNLFRRLEQVYSRALPAASSRGFVQVAALFAEAESELGRSLYSEHGDGCTCRPHLHCGPDTEIPGVLGENTFSALDACLEITRTFAVRNPWSEHCLAEANRVRAVEVPLGAELVPFMFGVEEPSTTVEPRKPLQHAASLIAQRPLRPPRRPCEKGALSVLQMAEGSRVAWLFSPRVLAAPSTVRPALPALFDHQIFLRELLRPSCGPGTVVVETARNRILSVDGTSPSCSANAQAFRLPNAQFTEEWARWIVDL
jgi:hypothetical protein